MPPCQLVGQEQQFGGYAVRTTRCHWCKLSLHARQAGRGRREICFAAVASYQTFAPAKLAGGGAWVRHNSSICYSVSHELSDADAEQRYSVVVFTYTDCPIANAYHPELARRDLEMVLQSLLMDQPVEVASTKPVGCRIS